MRDALMAAVPITGFTVFAVLAIIVMLFIGVQARIVTKQVEQRNAETE